MEIIIGILIIAALFVLPGILGYADQETRKKLGTYEKPQNKKKKSS